MTQGATLVVGDTATFHNTTQVVPTGSVMFTLYSDNLCATPTGVSGPGVIVTASGVSSATFSTSFTAAATGTYYWQASYGGDLNNTGFTTGCGDANEQLGVSGPRQPANLHFGVDVTHWREPLGCADHGSGRNSGDRRRHAERTARRDGVGHDLVHRVLGRDLSDAGDQRRSPAREQRLGAEVGAGHVERRHVLLDGRIQRRRLQHAGLQRLWRRSRDRDRRRQRQRPTCSTTSSATPRPEEPASRCRRAADQPVQPQRLRTQDRCRGSRLQPGAQGGPEGCDAGHRIRTRTCCAGT